MKTSVSNLYLLIMFIFLKCNFVVCLQAILHVVLSDGFLGPQSTSFVTLSSLLLITYKLMGFLLSGVSLIFLISFFKNIVLNKFSNVIIIHAASGSCRRLAMKVLFTTYSLSHFCFSASFSYVKNSWYLFYSFLGLNNLLMAYEDKSAYALCAFSFALGPNTEPITFMGKTPVW